MHFEKLPAGHSLKSNWPTQRYSPRHYSYRVGGYNENPVVDNSLGKPYETSTQEGQQSRASFTEPGNRRMASEGSPVKSRKASNAGSQRSLARADHNRKKSGNSCSPQKQATLGAAERTDDKAAMISGLKAVEDTADPNIDSTFQPLKPATSETNPSTPREDLTLAGSSTQAVQPSATDKDESTTSHPPCTENVPPSQTPNPGSEPSAPEGLQDTTSSTKTKPPNHKKKKSKPSNKPPVLEGKVQSTSQGQTASQNTRSAGKAKQLPGNDKSKKKSAKNVNDVSQKSQTKSETSNPSVTADFSVVSTDKVGDSPAISTTSRDQTSTANQTLTKSDAGPVEQSNASCSKAESSKPKSKAGESVSSTSSREEEAASQVVSRNITKLADDSVSIASMSRVPSPSRHTKLSHQMSQAMSTDTTKSADASASVGSVSTAATSLRQDARSNSNKNNVQSSTKNPRSPFSKEAKPPATGVDPDHFRGKLQANAAAPSSTTDDASIGDEDGQAIVLKPEGSSLTQKIASEAAPSAEKEEIQASEVG